MEVAVGVGAEAATETSATPISATGAPATTSSATGCPHKTAGAPASPTIGCATAAGVAASFGLHDANNPKMALFA